MNIVGDLLKIYAERSPQKVTFYYGADRKETWKEVNDRVNSLANALYDLGIRKGDKGIVMFHDCPEFIESTCALQKIGAIPSPMNYRFVSREIEYQTNNSDSKVFLTEDLWLENVKKAKPKMPKVENYIVLNNPEEELLDYESLIREYPSKEPPEVEVTWDDTAAIVYTGGTTGMPKGTVHTWSEFPPHLEGLLGAALKSLPQMRIPIGGDFTNNLLHRPLVGKFLADPGIHKIITNRILPMLRGRIPLEVKIVSNFPLFHMAFFGAGIESGWLLTGLVTFCWIKNPKFDPIETMELVDKLKPVALAMVPAQWYRLLEIPGIDKYDKSSLLLLGTGAGINPKKLKERMFKIFPNTMMGDGFGQTELAPVGTIRLDSSAQIDKIVDRSVGIPLTTVETKIVDDRGNIITKAEEIGELLYRSPTVMKEYYKDAKKTKEAITSDGWFHSEDLAYLDEAGEFHIVDRKGEVINVGGEKVFPHEVEEILESNPKVLYACLLGVPDEMYGKIPVGMINLREGEQATEEEMIDFCRDKMSGIKRPRFCVFVDEFPINPAGKVLRREVEEKFKGEIKEGYGRWKKKRK